MGYGHNDVDGRAWGSNVVEMRKRAPPRVPADKPRLLIGSQTCTTHSVMNQINHAHMAPEVIQARFADARGHLEFAAKVYKLQAQGGRHVLHEHPEIAPSWQEKRIRDV